MNKRNSIAAKTYGRCAYCGKILGRKFHVDHVIPTSRGGTSEDDNLLAACQRCNLWKKNFTLAEFKDEVESQWDRLYRDSAAFRLSADHNCIRKSPHPLRFFFQLVDMAKED